MGEDSAGVQKRRCVCDQILNRLHKKHWREQASGGFCSPGEPANFRHQPFKTQGLNSHQYIECIVNSEQKSALYFYLTPVCIVHITCEEAVDVVKRAKAQNKPVFGETCTHYLIFTQDKLFQEEDLESAKYICTPPLRQERDQKVLWDSLNNGWLQVIASDHCGIGLADMKAKALDDFTMIPNGSPGIGDRIPILWTYGVSAGKMTRTKLVDVCSTTPAKLNGIYPRKGHVGIGSDADLVILDPTYEGVVANEDNPNGEDYNIYEGMKLSGRIEKVFLRGKLVVDNHKFIGTLGQGKFIPSDLFGLAYRTNTHN